MTVSLPVRHLRLPLALRRAFSTPVSTKENLVILGSGWGGYNVLNSINKDKYNVTLISPRSYFNMTPLLAQTAVGTLEFRAAIESVRKFAPKATVLEAWADNVDFSRNVIRCTPSTPQYGTIAGRHSLSAPTAPSLTPSTTPKGLETTYGEPFDVKFDKLVIAVGAYSQTFGIPGVKENVHFLKDVKDARAIRMRVLECFAQASQPNCTLSLRQKLLNFVVVGGGPTGIEFAAELHDLCSTDMRKHYPELADHVKITIYETSDKILSSFDSALSEYASDRFARKGIQVKNSHGVLEVKPFSIKVEHDGWIPFGMCVWSTGLASNPLIQSITGLRKHARTGSLFTDKYLHVLDEATGQPRTNVWAIGDAAIIEDQPLPATAQVASQKAMYLVKALNKTPQGASDPTAAAEFKFVTKGSLAYIGNWEAIYDRSGAESGPQAQATGRVAWLLWRSAYFSMAMSPRNMLNIPWYWFTTWIFGRDLGRF